MFAGNQESAQSNLLYLYLQFLSSLDLYSGLKCLLLENQLFIHFDDPSIRDFYEQINF